MGLISRVSSRTYRCMASLDKINGILSENEKAIKIAVTLSTTNKLKRKSSTISKPTKVQILDVERIYIRWHYMSAVRTFSNRKSPLAQIFKIPENEQRIEVSSADDNDENILKANTPLRISTSQKIGAFSS